MGHRGLGCSLQHLKSSLTHPPSRWVEAHCSCASDTRGGDDGLLQDACQNGDLEKIKDLLQEGLDVNEVDDDGYTPTMIAATRGYANIVEYLISQRGDPNAQVRLSSDTHGGVPSELVRAHSPPSRSLCNQWD